MADGTHIEWTDATWNPITGCTLVSEGCRHCYAARLAATRLKHVPSRRGLARINAAGEAKFTGEVRFNEKELTVPLHWRRPRMIFVCAHGDLFHESVPDAWIDKIFAVMATARHHTFQILTKRPARMREYLDALVFGARYVRRPGWSAPDFRDRDRVLLLEEGQQWPLANVWLGTSVEDQARADERIPALLTTPAAVRFISAEPLLGPIDLRTHLGITPNHDDLRGLLHWVIVGGESGPGARPMHPDWARSLRDQCTAAGVAYFFKQWGAWETALDRDRDDPDWRRDYATDYVDEGKSRWLNLEGGRGFHGDRFHVMRLVGKTTAGRLLDGVEHSEMPRASA